MRWLLLAVLTRHYLLIVATKCFTCEGFCGTATVCNCHTGLCHGEYCYSERTPADSPFAYRISKGCMKRPSRTKTGCDFDQMEDNVLCVCKGDFCNDQIMVTPNSDVRRRSVTCRQCSERDPNCHRTCQGQWCYQDALHGGSGCGFGPPSLPYSYKGPELLAEARRREACITISRGSGAPRTHCICDRDECNDGLGRRHETAHRARSLTLAGHPDTPPLFDCISCESSMRGSVVGALCKKSFCRGHFCTYAAHRDNRDGIPLTMTTQGCINVTLPDQVQIGCTQKWLSNIKEDIHCACADNFCNVDAQKAHRSCSAKQTVLMTAVKIAVISHLCSVFIAHRHALT